MMKSTKIFEKIDFRLWMIAVLCYVYAVLSEYHPNKCFGLKIMLPMHQVIWTFNIFHKNGPKFEKKVCWIFCHQGDSIYVGLKTAKNGILRPTYFLAPWW